MAQAGYTPISLYYSTTAAAVPTSGNLASGELAINITDGKLYYKDNGGTVRLLASNATSAPVLSFSAGTTGFTPSTATTGAITLAGTLATTNGGTGLTSFTSGGVVYASSSSALATGSALTFDGTNLSTTGTLGVGAFAASSTVGLNVRFIGNLTGTDIQGVGSSISAPATASVSTINFYSSLRTTATSGSRGLLYNFYAEAPSIGATSTASTIYGLYVANQGNAGITNAYGVYIEAQSGSPTTNVGLRNGGTSILDGNVGIGVTPSVFTNTIKALQIGPTSVFRAGDTAYTQATFVASNARQETAVDYYIANGFATQYTQQGGAHIWATAVSGTAGNAIAFSQKMFLDVNGNLGIGTTSPATTLNVSGATGQTIMISNTSTSLSTGGSMGNLDFAAGTANTTNARVSGLVVGTSEAGGDLVVETRPDGGSLSERLRIASTGAFGLSGANYGTNGQVLTSGGSGAAPTWTTVSGGGGSPATPTVAGLVFGSMTAAGGTPFLTALGYNAGLVNTGTYNVFVGLGAGQLNTSGGDNVVVGVNALYSNITGTGNTAVGRAALNTSTAGTNTAVGFFAGAEITTGAQNTAIGRYSGGSNSASTGTANTSVGNYAGYRFTSGSYNVAIGAEALQANTTASNNTAVGYQAAYSTNTGIQNVALGTQALKSNTTNSYNTAVGYLALETATADQNVAVGWYALQKSTTGAGNTAVGAYVMNSNLGGASNTAVGFTALGANTTGSNNTAVGYQAGRDTSTGTLNTAVGYQALLSNTTANANTAIGYQALRDANRTADTTAWNTAVGYLAGATVTTGYKNVLIGYLAGDEGASLTTGYENVMIGNRPCPSGSSGNNQIVIGTTTPSVGKGNSTGFINPNGGGVYQGNNSSSWSTTSDQRLKKNIADNNDGLDKINSIRVRNFEYRLPEEVDAELKPTDAIQKTGVQLGVIAQELQAVLPECVKQESTGVLSVNTDNLTWYLINAIKELKAEFDAYKASHP